MQEIVLENEIIFLQKYFIFKSENVKILRNMATQNNISVRITEYVLF